MNENINYKIIRGSSTYMGSHPVIKKVEVRPGVFQTVEVDLNDDPNIGLHADSFSIASQIAAGIPLTRVNPGINPNLDLVDKVRVIPVPEGKIVNKNVDNKVDK